CLRLMGIPTTALALNQSGETSYFRSCIEFIKERLRFTGDDPTMATLMHLVMGAFAEFERGLLRKRQHEGIALAKRPLGLQSRRNPCATRERTAMAATSR